MATPGVFNKVLRVRPAQGNGGAFNQYDATVAASQAIKMYDIVKLSSGQVVQSINLPGSNSTGTASGGSTSVYGIALADITTTASGTETATGRSTIPVAIFDGNLEVLMRVYNSTAGDSQQQDLTLGNNYQYQRWRGANASDWWYSLITTTTNGEFRLVEFSPESNSQDNYGLVWVRAGVADTTRQG